MQIHSLCVLPAALLRYRPREGRWAIAVICKATYRLGPVTAVLAPEQDPLQNGEKHFNDDPMQSVEYPNDFVPFKPRAEVLLVGNAFAPQRRPTRMVSVRMIVGSLNKALDVYGPRTLHADGTVREGSGWTSMPLRYERAAGGPETWNPVGLNANWDTTLGTRMLPQIVAKGDYVSEATQTFAPDGFGPISARWRVRYEKLKPHEMGFLDNKFEPQVIGSDFDSSFFQAAPRDQQLDELRPDERIVLENLHPEHSRLVTNLPGLAPVMFFSSAGNTPTPMPMRPDTLWIDTHRGVCTLTFRGHLMLSSFDQPGTVVVLLQESGRTVTWSEVESKLPRNERRTDVESKRKAGSEAVISSGQRQVAYNPDTTTDIDIASLHNSRRAIPFGTPSTPAPSAPNRLSPSSDEDDTTSRHGTDSGWAQAAPVTTRQESTYVMKKSELLGATPVTPFGNSPSMPNLAGRSPNAPMDPNVATRLPMAPPPLPGVVPPRSTASSPTFAVPPAPPAAPIPPAPVGNFPIPAPPPSAPTLGTPVRATPPAFTGVAAAPAFAHHGSGDTASAVSLDLPPAKTIGEMQVKSKSATGYDGVLAASNAAADAQSQEKPHSNQRAREKPIADQVEPANSASIEVIWYESTYVPRIRKHAQWASFIQPPPKPVAVQRGQAPPPPPSAEALEEAADADVFAVLSNAEPTREHEVVPGRKSNKDRETALYLLAGTITFPLDDIELLKATSRAAAPLAAGDKKLKEVLDLVDEVLKMPLDGAPEIVQNFTVRVRDAWTNANRILPPDYLITHTERTLLNQRHYQKRELLDDEWIRALYLSSPDANPIPTYIPAKLAKRLPLFRQVSARILVEALSQQDMYESHAIALRVVALARVLTPQESSNAPRGRR